MIELTGDLAKFREQAESSRAQLQALNAVLDALSLSTAKYHPPAQYVFSRQFGKTSLGQQLLGLNHDAGC